MLKLLSWSMSSCVYGKLCIVKHVNVHMLSNACDTVVVVMHEVMVCAKLIWSCIDDWTLARMMCIWFGTHGLHVYMYLLCMYGLGYIYA